MPAEKPRSTVSPSRSAPKKATAAKSTKPAAKKPVAAKAEGAEKAAPRARKKAAAPAVPPAQRAHYIEMAAYYIAERRGFAPGDPLADWVAAEAEIDRLIADGLIGG